jgi:2-dehydro-3-deoxyphosphooctonate aldolase (KDO 8-P synthase)
VAGRLKEIAQETGARIVFKSSFDKANRSSRESFRGPGLEEGLSILAEVKARTGLPVISDIHGPEQAEPAARVLDVIQIPAFLSRQTDLIQAAARTGKPLNVKKGQFLAPDDMAQVVEKARAAGNEDVMLCERGTSFGYHNLVVDMRSLPMMRELGCPIVYDATHSLQLPGGGKETGGLKQYAAALARAAAATGAVDGFFLEVHDRPEKALSDSSTQLDLKIVPGLLREILAICAMVRRPEEKP